MGISGESFFNTLNPFIQGFVIFMCLIPFGRRDFISRVCSCTEGETSVKASVIPLHIRGVLSVRMWQLLL